MRFPSSFFSSRVLFRFLFRFLSRFHPRFHSLFCLNCLGVSIALPLLLAAPGAGAQQPPPVVAEALQKAGIPKDAVGIYVQEAAPKGKMLVALNASAGLNPASVMKLITTDAALELLGPGFNWKTKAYADGAQNGDVLNGDLIFKGGGDPKLVIENFWLFLRQIRARGIRDIRGNVVLDRGMFAPAFYDAAQFDGDPRKPYNVGPDALLLNYKTLAVRFMPDSASGTVNVMLDPPLADVAVRPPALGLGTGTCDGENWRDQVQEASDEKTIAFNGIFPAACGEKVWYLHPYRMTGNEYFAAVFRQMWRDLGGKFDGKVVSGTVPDGARQVGEWQSATLPEVIRDINKYSNNVMARQVLLTLAATIAAPESNAPADTAAGARVIQDWLGGKGIAAPELVVDNGAGLSRIGRVAPATLGQLLLSAFQSATMPELLSSMPLVGVDGTMRKRLKDREVSGQAHVKTGSLNNVRAIAGYVLASSGKYYVVVFLINHPNAVFGQKAQDALLQWVYEH
ncbi:D-alanyl-D-alanine carboxypeptidase/D-alanyl-D-alanine-endopeptidase [Oxalobacteraceae bacterium CAVE-383]|nr:D-alanyl-D-alanine carboxypeptidase/D-alanyl-D-alanine-endopeptidase [Oxalobacteraceae bacterium CAVE-383]